MQAKDFCIKKMDKLTISNKVTWKNNEGYFYHSDTADSTIWQFDDNVEDAKISSRIPIISIPKSGDYPAVMPENEGKLWEAFWDGWKI